MGLIENIYFGYRLYGYIHAWIRIYFRSFRSFRIHGASSPCCVLAVVFIIKNVYFLSPLLGPVQGPVHVLYYALEITNMSKFKPETVEKNSSSTICPPTRIDPAQCSDH